MARQKASPSGGHRGLARIGMNGRITIARSEQEISSCYPVMAELRPHIRRDEFVPTVRRLAEVAGFRLAYLTDVEVKAVAGFRISEWLAGGRYLEVEDLVVKSGERSKGYGGELFDWLVAHAVENDCSQVRLVSRVSRLDAHRFYLKKGMKLEAYYFSMDV
jgi:GNAT superfamily N-acetyltransferase